MESVFYPQFDYKVLVKCNTYNHSKYIEDALMGFAIQKTTFPFVCLVTDDCSTDGAQQVIKSWIDKECDVLRAQYIEVEMSNIVVVPHKINHNCTFAFYFLKQNLFKKPIKKELFNAWAEKSKYIATCEGDDYWIHPDKLQMQVGFLESHSDYVMCHTDFALAGGGLKNHNVQVSDNDVFFPKSIQGELQIGTLTVLFLTKVYEGLPQLWKDKNWPMSDTPMWIEMSKAGKIKYLPTKTAFYRVLDTSASHGDLEKEISFSRKAIEIRKFYAEYYGVQLPNSGYSIGFFITVEKKAFKYGNKSVARKYRDKAKELGLTSNKMWLFYCATVCPLFGSMLRLVYRPA